MARAADHAAHRAADRAAAATKQLRVRRCGDAEGNDESDVLDDLFGFHAVSPLDGTDIPSPLQGKRAGSAI
jgi:hypothetical protein